ncbi:MAG TPA: hypothetical protein VGO40_10140, partial [Longimicrobium sp.]|nr:hypothetical protein [Longimicrobium sp.]
PAATARSLKFSVVGFSHCQGRKPPAFGNITVVNGCMTRPFRELDVCFYVVGHLLGIPDEFSSKDAETANF